MKVFHQLYQDSVKCEFKVGSHCSALFENGEDQMEWFDGVIKGIADNEYEHQQYRVKWDSDGEVSSHSVWELMPKGSHDIQLCQYASLESTNIERISRLLGEIIKNNDYHAFNDDVEDDFHDDYWKEIAYPTCLNQIKSRIESSYYRSVEAVNWEVNLLHTNCAKFNGDNDQSSNGLFSVSSQLAVALSRVIKNSKLTYKDFVKFAEENMESDEDEELSEEDHNSEEEETSFYIDPKKKKKTKVIQEESDDDEESEAEPSGAESDESFGKCLWFFL